MRVNCHCRALVLLLPLLVYLTFLSQRQIVDDLWMHLAVGKHIGVPGGAATPDIFTYVENDRPWVPHLWLSSLWLFWAYEAAGMEGVRWFFLAANFFYLFAVANFFQVVATRTSPDGAASFLAIRTPLLTSALGVCFVFALSLDRFRHRPIIFEMMFLYLATALLASSWPRPKRRHVLTFYLLTALFLNLHSGALIVPIIVVGWGVGEVIARRARLHTGTPGDSLDWRRVGIVMAVLLGSVTTPYHVHLWIYIFGPKPFLEQVPEYFSTLHYFRNDNFARIPPERIPIVLAPWLVMLLLVSPCLVKAGTLVWGVLRRRLRWGRFTARLREIPAAFPLSLPELLLSLPLLYLSVRHVRFLYMAGVPLAFYLRNVIPRPIARPLFAVVTIGCLAYVTWDRLGEAVYCVTHPDEHLKAGAFPVDGTRFLEEQHVRGRIYCTNPLWSTYLLWRLYPDCQTFFDMRHIYGGMNVFNLADAIERRGAEQVRLLRHYDINIVVSAWPFAFADEEKDRWRLAFNARRKPFEYVYLRIEP